MKKGEDRKCPWAANDKKGTTQTWKMEQRGDAATISIWEK